MAMCLILRAMPRNVPRLDPLQCDQDRAKPVISVGHTTHISQAYCPLSKLHLKIFPTLPDSRRSL